MTPAPDGRGGRQPAPSPKGPNPRWVVVALVLTLLGLNLWISSQALSPAPRVSVPYYPTFVNQVKTGNVNQISSTGNSIQGTFRQALKYPPDSKSARPTTLFKTQIPSFANNNQLSSLLQRYNVTINAQPLGPGRRSSRALSSASGRRCCSC